MQIVLALLVMLVTRQQSAGDVVIPLVGRPPNFSGAAGLYRIEVAAKPTKVHVEEPIHLTVTIVSLQPGALSSPPQRDKLRLFSADMERNFFIEPLPEEDRSHDGSWEFHWRLMPKHARAREIPPMEFVYYQSSPPTGFKAADGAHSIALDVKPRIDTNLAGSTSANEQFQHLVEGQSILRRNRTSEQMIWLAVTWLVLPPLTCFAIFHVWRRLFPEAAERLRRQRSRALRTALAKLARLRTPTTIQVRAIVADYLRLRADLPQGEPTPVEARNRLGTCHADPELAERTEAFFQTCDAELFSPQRTAQACNLRDTATQLLISLESSLCSQPAR